MTAPPFTDEQVAAEVELIRTGDRNARDAAAWRLKQAGAWDLSRLQPILDHPHVSRRVKGVEILGAYRTREAAALLVARLDDPDWLIRDKAVRALVKVGQPARALVAEALRNAEEGPQRLAILEAACRLGEPSALSAAQALAIARSPHARVFGLRMLYRLKALTSSDFLTALADPDAAVRELAVELMGRAQRPELLEPLVARLLDGSVRSFLVYQAIRKHGALAIDALVTAAARVPDGESRARVAEALHGCLFDQRARQRFDELWVRPEPAVRDACLLLLGDGYARDLDAELRLRAITAHVRDPERHRRATCVRALERLAEARPEALTLLDLLTADPDPEIAAHARITRDALRR